MHTHIHRQLCLVVLSLFAVGCSTLNIQKPTASITGMAVQDVNANGFTMNFNIDLANPNAVALPLTAADYTIGLGGINVAKGKANPEGSIPAGGTKSMILPVTLNYESLLAAEQAIVKSGGNVPYALDGGLSFKTGAVLLGDLRVPLQYNGTLMLKEVLNNPKALLQSPAARKLANHFVSGLFGI